MSQANTCSIEIHRTSTGYLFRVVGRGTLRESPAVRDFVCGAMEDGADIVMDLSQCEHLDSTFLGCLVILQQRGEGDGGAFAVFADALARQRLFDVSHLDRIIAFVEQLPECMASSVQLQVTNLDRQEFCQHLLVTHRRLAELGGPAAATFQRIVEQLQQDLEELT